MNVILNGEKKKFNNQKNELRHDKIPKSLSRHTECVEIKVNRKAKADVVI
jgi:hypothetical protein